MIGLILWGLLLYLLHILLPPVLFFSRPDETLGDKLRYALGPRDAQAQLSVGGERARRALRNYEESLPFFLTIALLLLYVGNTEGLAAQGAMVFLISRLIYLPVYVAGIPTLRTIVWLGGWAGLAMMIVSLHS